jgi:hypothetical protein
MSTTETGLDATQPIAPQAFEAWVPPIEALEKFAARLTRGAKVFCADDDAAAAWLKLRGFEVALRDPAKDLRLTSLPRSGFAGIWVGASLERLSIEDAQRVVATFFQALVPKTGTLFVAHPYSETGFGSMLRQNGFQILDVGRQEARSEGGPSPWQAVTAHRI